jgi:hypothetical protein
LFSAVSIATVLLAGSFASNLLHEIYEDRRRQYATLISLGLSPAIAIALAVAFGLSLAIAGAGAGGLAAIVFVPRSFAMPSLMADLGPTQPTIDWIVLGSIFGIAVAAVVIGLASTSLRLARGLISTNLLERNS